MRTWVDDARRALDQLDNVLASPAASQLPGLPVARTFTAVDSAAGDVHSEDKRWKAAWKKDKIKGKHLLGRYALENASEGFTEFGRILAEKGLDHMVKHWPNAVNHLQAKGLL